jgi:hypothetical protein
MARLGSVIPARQHMHMLDLGSLAFRFLLAVDIEGFSQRHTAEQAQVQNDLENVMTLAASSARLDRRRWYRQPRGDGELAVLPLGVNGLSVVADYPRELASAVAQVNLTGNGEFRLRVRLAIHHGATASGWFGPIGTAPVVVSRLVDAEIVRQQLRRRPDIDIALIVSAAVYDEIIQSRLRDLNPGCFRRVITRKKGVSCAGYLYQDSLAAQGYSVPVPHEKTCHCLIGAIPRLLNPPPPIPALPPEISSAHLIVHTTASQRVCSWMTRTRTHLPR